MTTAAQTQPVPRLDVPTLLRQLGNVTLALLGAKNLVRGEDRLQFAIGSGAKNRANRVVIRLEWDDTYTVEVWRCRGVDLKKLGEREGVYVENLHDVLESLTGLVTRF